MKKLILSFLLLLAAATANAQFAPGAVLKASDLNAALAAPTISGGSINNAPIGQTTPATGRFTTLQIGSGASSFNADGTIGLAAGTKLGFSSTTAFGNNFVRYNAANTGLQIDSNGATVFTNGVSNTERARFDASGNLGINTSNPAYKLDVNGHMAVRGANANFWWNADNTNYADIYNPGTTGAGNAAIAFEVGGAERMRIDKSGNLGFGSLTNAWGATYRAIDYTTGAGIYGTGVAAGFASNTYFNGTNWIYKTSTSAGRYDVNGTTHRWFIAPSGTAGSAATFTQAMTLDSNGLSLGAASAVPGAYQAITFPAGVYNKAQIRGYSSSSTDAGELAFLTAPDGDILAERVRINSVGNVGIATTPQVSASGFKSLEIGAQTLMSQTSTGSTYLGKNWYYNGGYKYKLGGGINATNYVQDGNGHAWNYATAGAADAALTWSLGMALDMNGALGLGVTPSAWGAPMQNAIELKNGAFFASNASGPSPSLGSNAYYNGTSWVYKTSAKASQYVFEGSTGSHQWNVAPSGTAGAAITWTQAMILDNTGKLTVAGGTVNLGTQTTPVTSSAACAKGDIETDANYIYVCTATNTWKRASLATF